MNNLESPPPKDCAILCVDDEAMVLTSLKEQLQRRFGNRYVYEVADSVADAWVVIDELQIDGVEVLMIVSDWLMPGVKGDQFLIEVKQRYPQIRSIMLTGQADETAIARTYKEADLFACLYKPWQEDELAQVVTAALNDHN
jgi:CheY-like chemotaxis protein